LEQNYYQVLGVSQTASEKEIKSAWRKLAATEHPDKHGGAPEYVARFQDINKAYETLRDAAKRAEYDVTLNGAASPPQGARQTGQGSAQARGAQTAAPRPQDRRAASAVNPLNDLFAGMGGMFTGERPREASTARPTTASGSAVPSGEYKLDITLEEAFHGAQRSIKVNMTLPCPDCNGTGRTQKTRGGLAIGPVACPTCSGKGRKSGLQVVSVNVRPGVYEGAKLQPPGTTLLVTVHIKKHDVYTVEGKDLTLDVPVPYTVLVLGGQVQVPTLAGSRTLPIPPGTQGGQKIKMSGLGLPALGQKPAGDLYVRISIPVPRSPDLDERRLLTELARLRKDPII
jgi:molecular chaperone DnaJ